MFITPCFYLLLAQLTLDHGLRGDARVVRAGKPEDFVAGLPCPAGEDVL
jgi:hypothetical protein